jgi:formamidopyrimidine-DNA glycosylase
MPELPEVETVRLGLSPVLTGQRLIHVEQRRPNLRFPFPANFVARVQGQTVERLDRRSKYIIAHLSGGEALIMHLGMLHHHADRRHPPARRLHAFPSSHQQTRPRRL